MGIYHSPRTAHSPWTKGLVEVQNRNLGKHLRMFLYDTPKNWVFQVHMYAHAHNSQPLSELNVSPHEIVFHTRPRIPLTFDLIPTRDTSKTCISRYCLQLPQHSQYDKSNQNTFKTHSTMVSRCRNCYVTIILYCMRKYNTQNKFPCLYYKNLP